jgi:hypothetical protein
LRLPRRWRSERNARIYITDWWTTTWDNAQPTSNNYRPARLRF